MFVRSELFRLTRLKPGTCSRRPALQFGAVEEFAELHVERVKQAQFAVPEVFARSRDFARAYGSWVAGCRAIVLEKLAGLRFAAPRGGFYLTLAIEQDEDEAALRALREERVLAHPGWFYDIEPNHLVLTFVHEPARLADALTRLRRLLL